MEEFSVHTEGWLNMPSSFHPPRFWSGLAGSGGGTACVSGGLHFRIPWKPCIIYWPWRAGAEAEGEEEEGHYAILV